MAHESYIRWVPGVRLMKWIGRTHTRLYRWTGGRVGGRMDGLDILLLTTTGRKSGAPRTSPLPYFRDGDRYLVVASFGGNPRNPDWYRNLAARPEVDVELGARRFRARARTAGPEERPRLWKQITDEQPRYAEYAKKTDREIPVVVLEPLPA